MSHQRQDPLPPPPDPAKFNGQLAIDLVCLALGIVGATFVLLALGRGLLGWLLGWVFAITVFAAAVALSRFLRKSFGVNHLSRTVHSAHQASEKRESQKQR